MPRKPASNELRGVVRQRASGRWQAVITFPRDDNGDYPQISKTFDTQREAEHWRLEQTDPRRKPMVERGMTVETLLERWLAHQAGRLAAKTHHTYGQYVRNRVIPAIGKKTLSQLSVDDLDDLYTALTKDGMAPASVRQVHAIIRSALSWGRKRRYVDINVAVDADVPSVPKRKIKPPTAAQVVTLMATAAELDHEFGVAVRLAAATGARRGTVACFRESDFAFAENTVLLDRSLSIVNGKRIIKGLKHEDGGGTIPLDESTMNIVLAHIEWLHERAKACDVKLVDDFYLFAEDPQCSIPVDPDRFTRQWKTVRRRAKLPAVQLKSLRHYMVTSVIASGFDVLVAADRARHASAKMTLDVYGSAVSEESRKAADHIGRLLDGLPVADGSDG